MTETTFHCEGGVPVIGQIVSYTNRAEHGETYGRGTYLGVAMSEDDGEPMHYFARGYMNGTPQACFGFPAAEGTSPTTDLTPTDLITREAEQYAQEQAYEIASAEVVLPLTEEQFHMLNAAVGVSFDGFDPDEWPETNWTKEGIDALWALTNRPVTDFKRVDPA